MQINLEKFKSKKKEILAIALVSILGILALGKIFSPSEDKVLPPELSGEESFKVTLIENSKSGSNIVAAKPEFEGSALAAYIKSLCDLTAIKGGTPEEIQAVISLTLMRDMALPPKVARDIAEGMVVATDKEKSCSAPAPVAETTPAK